MMEVTEALKNRMCVCGNLLRHIDVYETECDDDTYIDYLDGFCECGKHYTWTEHYKFSHVELMSEE